MFDALLSLLSGGLPYIIGAGAVFIVFVATLMKGRSDGARLERAKQAASDARARDIADEIDDAVAGRSPDQNRQELRRWSRG